MTLEQFLRWEDGQEHRHEFDGVRAIALTGSTVAHATVQANLVAILVGAVRGTPYRAVGNCLKIKVAGHIRYPDAFILCSPAAPSDKVITEPVVVFEILSPGAAGLALVVKNAEYRATPSIQHYVVLEQDAVAGTVFTRSGADWMAETLDGPDAVLRLPAVGLDLKLAGLYAGLDLQG